MNTFRHSGDLGDIVYALPTMRQLGGGELYLDVDGGTTSAHVRHMTDIFGRTRLKFNRACYDFLKPLLEIQPYISKVDVWTPEIKITHDFDEPRANWPAGGKPIAYVYADHFKVMVAARERWIFVEPTPPQYDLIVARSLRYQSNHGFWEAYAPWSHTHKCGFVGSKLEYQVFREVFPEWWLPHLEVANALGLAQVIASGEQFAGNQSLPMAIAIGLGKEFTQEVYMHDANCVVEWGRYV